MTDSGGNDAGMTTNEPSELERIIREAYRAGDYACAYGDGMVWRKRESDPIPPPPETEDEVVARLTAHPGRDGASV